MSADYQAHGLSIADAARQLGISENAIRQRIKRGTVDAAKVDGVWRVTLDDSIPVADHQGDYQTDQEDRPLADYEPRLAGDQSVTSRAVVSDAARAQLEAVRDEWLQPLIDQLRETERTLGRTEAERDQVMRERDALQAEIDRLRVAESAKSGFAPDDAQNGPGRVDPHEMTGKTLHGAFAQPVPTQVSLATGWRRWWRRVMGHEG